MSVNAQFGFVLEYVPDIAAATRFYVDQLGLAVEREHPTFVQFRDAAGVAYAIATDPPLGGGDPEICWVVEDVEAAYRELSARAGITISLPLTERPFGKVFAIIGPSGMPHYLLTFARNRPSRAVE